jgi:agmatinase
MNRMTTTVKINSNVLGRRSNFLGIDSCCGWEEAQMVVLQAPLEATVSYMRGTGHGPSALIQASHQIEFYDDELRAETFRSGIATLPPPRFSGKSIKTCLRLIDDQVTRVLQAGKKPFLIGGEHTVSIGAIRACHRKHPGLTVLHLDAHTDLRDSYEGSPFSHACVMARVAEFCPFVSIGIRSLSIEEAEQIETQMLHVFDMHRMQSDAAWAEKSLALLGDTVYVTVDLDVLDPSIMPAVGTPEPGGMGWRECLDLLRRVFSEKKVVGLDMVELCPRPGAEHGVYTAAKMAYRLAGYWLYYSNKSLDNNLSLY